MGFTAHAPFEFHHEFPQHTWAIPLAYPKKRPHLQNTHDRNSFFRIWCSGRGKLENLEVKAIAENPHQKQEEGLSVPYEQSGARSIGMRSFGMIRVILTMWMLVSTVGRAEVAFYVSPTGNDNNPGSLEQPFATLKRARDTAREVPRHEPIVLYLRAGSYYLNETLEFKEKDSGTEQAPLTLRNWPGERVVLSGGKRLDLKWEPFQKGIFKANVPADQMKGLAVDQLFVNGQRQILARYPNYDPSIRYFQGFSGDSTSPERVKRWNDPTGGFVHAMHNSHWGSMHFRIRGKENQEKLQLEGGWQNNRPEGGFHPEHRFVENIFEELDAPGEWFYDWGKGLLYFMPPPDLDLASARFEVSGLKSLIELRGSNKNPIRFINIQGITFAHTARTFMEPMEPLLRSDWMIYRGGTIFLEGTEQCRIQDCFLDQVGGNALFVSDYNRDLEITGCKIVGAGASGVCFVGDTDCVRSPSFHYSKSVDLDRMDWTPGPKGNNFPARCVLRDNLIHTIGTVEKQTAGVEISMSQDITVSHNSIYRTPRAGINIGDGTWGGHLIEWNDVFDTVLETGDHGAFNSWGRDRYWRSNSRQMQRQCAEHPDLPLLDVVKPIELRFNRWRCDHGWDIDLDDGSSNYRIFGNLCLNGGIKLREGFNRTVENNILVNNSLHPHVWFKNSNDRFVCNIVQNAYQPIQMSAWGKEINFNLLPDTQALEQSRKLNLDLQSKAGNPMFENPKQGDYRVRNGSPALDLGFQNIRMDQFGVLKPTLRLEAEQPLFKDAPAPAPQNRQDTAEHTWLGARVKNVTTLGERSVAGLPDQSGLRILEAPDNSLAQRVGLKDGDVLTQCAGEKVTDYETLLFIFEKASPTANILPLQVFRNQKARNLNFDTRQWAVLSARQAHIGGSAPLPKYDAQKDYIGAWTHADAFLEWKDVRLAPGKYRVRMLLACQPGSEGSVLAIECNGHQYAVKVPATRTAEDFTIVRAGTLEITNAEKQTFAIRPTKKTGPSVMNLRRVELVRVP